MDWKWPLMVATNQNSVSRASHSPYNSSPLNRDTTQETSTKGSWNSFPQEKGQKRYYSRTFYPSNDPDLIRTFLFFMGESKKCQGRDFVF